MLPIRCGVPLARRIPLPTGSAGQLARRAVRARLYSRDVAQLQLGEPFSRRLLNSTETRPVEVDEPEQALERHLESGSHVFVHSAAATPAPLLTAMATVAAARKLTGIEVKHIHIEGNAPHLAAAGFHDTSFFVGANCRGAVNGSASADYVPVFLSEIPILFRRGIAKIDIALIQVSPPDAHGFCSLGPSVDVTRAALQVAKVIIAVVNPQVPRVFGDGSIHISHLDTIIRRDVPLFERQAKSGATAVETAIGRLIAEELVGDGATLQLGIGAIPDAVLSYCGNHKDLGVHSEMFSDGIIPLVAQGVINNRLKTFDVGKVTGSFAYGTKALYAFMHDNPGVVMRDVTYVNDTHIIRQQPQMTAINSAIEVDITGQVCADSIGTRIFSGVGGQMDFIRGAGLCPDGKPIIALPATTHKGESRIVSTLKTGASVVTTRAHVHHVVTEHGIVQLFGKSLRERAAALISIAAPEHRDALRAAARERGLM